MPKENEEQADRALDSESLAQALVKDFKYVELIMASGTYKNSNNPINLHVVNITDRAMARLITAGLRMGNGMPHSADLFITAAENDIKAVTDLIISTQVQKE